MRPKTAASDGNGGSSGGCRRRPNRTALSGPTMGLVLRSSHSALRPIRGIPGAAPWADTVNPGVSAGLGDGLTAAGFRSRTEGGRFFRGAGARRRRLAGRPRRPARARAHGLQSGGRHCRAV